MTELNVNNNEQHIRGQRANIMFIGEDHIDIFLKEHWIKFNHVVHMIKYGRNKRIRNKYINRYEKERRFILKIINKHIGSQK